MKPSILFVTNSSNWPLTDGKRQRTWFLIEALTKKYFVDILLIGYATDKKHVEGSTSTIRSLFFVDVADFETSKINYPIFLLSRGQRIQRQKFKRKVDLFFLDLINGNSYDFLFSRYLDPLFYFSLPEAIKVVCDVDDVYFEKMKSRIKNETNFKRKIQLHILFYFEKQKIKKLLQRIDIPIIVKASDTLFFGLQDAFCLPNLPFGYFINKKTQVDSIETTENPPLTFGFIGKLSYKPNYQGLIDFIQQVWHPLIKDNFQARLLIAGSGVVPESLRILISNSKNIHLLGFVSNSEQFWDATSVLVVPVAEGAGSNIKIAEALIQGKSVIAHPFASRGYEKFIHSGYLSLPQNSSEWIKVLSSVVVSTPEEKQVLIQKAKNHFDLDDWNSTLIEILA